jgi:hypothetical protein
MPGEYSSFRGLREASMVGNSRFRSDRTGSVYDPLRNLTMLWFYATAKNQKFNSINLPRFNPQMKVI